MLTLALSRAVARTLPALPDALDRPASEAFGTLAYLAAPRARRAVRANLAIICPQRADRERLVRRAFVLQARNYMETFRIGRSTPEQVLASVTQRGWEHFGRAVERGNGVILVSAHLGPVALCGQVVLALGHRITIPIEPETSELARLLNRARSGMGAVFVPTDSPLALRRALRDGGILGFLADRAVTGSGERVPFFGREALLPSAHVAMALRTGAALVAAFALREGERLIAAVEPEIELPRSGDRAADVREGVRRWAAVLESYIARAPEQWSVFEPVWEPR